MSEAPSREGSDPVLVAFFGKYLAGHPVPILADFQQLNAFGLFDEALAAEPRPRGRAKEELLRQATDCLEHVLVKAYDGIPERTEFGPGVKLGHSVAHHEAWILKCFSNPIADSIRAKCSVVLAPATERPPRTETLKDETSVRRLCGDLGRPDLGPELHRIILRSLDLFEQEESGELIPPALDGLNAHDSWIASRRAFHDGFVELWRSVPATTPETMLAVSFALAKLRDYASQGLLNRGRTMQFVPGEVFDWFVQSRTRRWPSAHVRAGLTFLQDAPVGPNGELFKSIWRLWGVPRSYESDDQLLDCLELLLRLLEKKGFHHDISDFKRVLRLLPPARVDLLLRFQPRVPQGCFTALAVLFREHRTIPFPILLEMVDLLDTARGKAPSSRWGEKRASLQAAGHWDDVVSFATWLREHEHLTHPFGPGGWTDDVFRRFSKASSWILAN